VIFVSYNAQKTDSIARMILGQIEPSGLLVFQQPASMEAVEAQIDDVPRYVEVYKDAAGNTYDFAFGMNWSGVINDGRTAKYSAAPLTKVQSHDFGDKLKTAAAE
jgi:beta-glucosidase